MSTRSSSTRFAAASLTIGLAIFAGGCMEALVDDDGVAASTYVLPANAEVPYVATNADLERQIRINDGLSDSALTASNGLIASKNGYAKGAKIKYWDLGDAPQTGSLVYVLVADQDGTKVPLAHPLILDSLPGDPGWSPFHFVQYVTVTSRYADQILPSTQALTDAIELGLVHEPESMPLFLNGPVVQAGARLDNGAGKEPTVTTQVYARGYLVDMLPVGGMAAIRTQARANRLARGDVHRIWVGNAINAANEPTFQNAGSSWTPGVRVIECRVKAPEPAPVPTPPLAADEWKYTDEKSLFGRDMSGNLSSATNDVITWTMTTTFKNWPIVVAP